MSDDLNEHDSAVVRQLEALSPLFLKGWAKRHPMPAGDRAMIEQAFGQAKAAQQGSVPDSTAQAGTAGKKPASQSQTGPSETHDQRHDRGR